MPGLGSLFEFIDGKSKTSPLLNMHGCTWLAKKTGSNDVYIMAAYLACKPFLAFLNTSLWLFLMQALAGFVMQALAGFFVQAYSWLLDVASLLCFYLNQPSKQCHLNMWGEFIILYI